ncbi:MAG TPA: ADP-ribosylglycohydrolase family protein, partial [Actinomycetota bacterium]|nr:ADP-ribosylglycohydrolase family protein [Actinomycetota bacterium]
DPVAAILAAANAGDDADTVAAIAGAVCGAGAGPEVFPTGWVDERTVARIRALSARLARARAALGGGG